MRLPLRSAHIQTWRSTCHILALALLVCVCCPGRTAHAQPLANTHKPQETSMQHYALLFRTTRTLTPDEQKQRGADIAAWIKQVTEMGITLAPHSLEETITAIPAEGAGQPAANDPALSNIVLFDATRDQAMQIARTHPAPRYGVNLELREWTTPRPLAPRP
jgi:hypothetical protein